MNNETEGIFIITPPANQPPATSQKLEEASVTTPQDVEDFSTVCRTCATVTEFVIPIFDGEGLQNNLAEKIHKHLPIRVCETDILPRVVCYQCASTLLAWHELVQCCVQADAALRTRLAVCAAAAVASADNTPQEKPLESECSSKEAQNTENEQQNKHISKTHVQAEVKIKVEAGTNSPSEISKLPTDQPYTVLVGDDGKRCAMCKICKKNVNISSWKRHVRNHRGEKRYSCYTCGLAFNDSGNLARHSRAIHNNQRLHTCQTCNKTFSRKSHLEDHYKTHSERREFICDLCGKASKSGAALRMHKKVHDPCKFQCMECGSKFKRRGELRVHVTVHTGEKAHTCFCGRGFRLRSQLTMHARTHDTTPSKES